MCKYCESGLYEMTPELYEDPVYSLQISKYTPISGDKRYLELYNSHNGESFKIEINYCPICGNLLKVGMSNERNKKNK